MFQIFPIPAFQDNYIWVGVDKIQRQVFVVDPGDAKPVLSFLHQHQLTLATILITHKHHDHTGGISALLSQFPNASVFSHPTENISQTTHLVSDCDVFQINNHTFAVITIPGHTLGHIAYYSKPYLFCGDTLFTNGCGKIFEGTASMMLSSLKKLMMLPDDTQIYCGHEYTLSNIRFALHVEPHNVALQKRFADTHALRLQNEPTVPSTLRLEKATNPFLRCDVEDVVRAVSVWAKQALSLEVEVFCALREWKDGFSG